MQPRQHSKRRHRYDTAPDAVDQWAHAIARAHGDSQREDAEVHRKPPALEDAPLAALRPGRRNRAPHGKSGEQAEQQPAAPADATRRQRADDRTEQNEPPDRDADLTPHDDVVAAALEPQIDDERRTEQPCSERAKIGPRERSRSGPYGNGCPSGRLHAPLYGNPRRNLTCGRRCQRQAAGFVC